ncbi:protein cordon-bleu isoform X1 [Erinaceus europaeus]|uniref:Protein cordon-bleu isoform X1 n=1 Tax=Erinaceus europaeus TaxID=9365 RepID=A0ABM3VT79_ERIEU|nr:protein cordon-bleu isoform X1 [Erinaceus europaeus]
MDLLVELCLQNHLNPSHHALEIWSSENQQPLSFKPNTLVGTLDVHTVIVKEKVLDEKNKNVPSKLPEKSVLLVVNYLRTQKTVVRVSPEVPLQNILPAICAKCEVSPEHVVLLRDNIAGEELELSKSLNELGIKELYAWDNKRVLLTKTQSEPSLRHPETFRKASLGNDETDKEKKKFLEFFRVHKRSNSKVEQPSLSPVDSEEDTSRSLGQGLNGCLTMPNSPSSKSRSLMLGPSLSLSNISGVSVKSDMKKRRAPPPPSLPGARAPSQDRASEKMSLGSQIDLQKKKRRAPAPPPPQPPPLNPLVPNRLEDKEEKRKSTMGVQRQVPQKPPRGSTRGAPRLVLPPPPPYPPPDTDVAEPLGFSGEGAGAQASDPRPTLNLTLEPRGPCSTDGIPPAPSEAEETVSVGSCFASEDTTEDSGVMSSPSDIISLDSQHDSTKSRDKWATDQEDCSDQDLASSPDPVPQKSSSWESNKSGSWHPRAERTAAISNDEENVFISGQFQKVLTELDEDLEDMEETYETDSISLSNSVNGVSGHCTQNTTAPGSDEDTIPVTFIGEVLDDPADSDQFSNRNNNAGSFDLSRAPQPCYQAEHSRKPAWKREEVSSSWVHSQDRQKEIKLASSTQKDRSSAGVEPRATGATKVCRQDLSAKQQDQEPGPIPSLKTQVKERESSQPPREKEGDSKKNGALVPPSWYQRDQNAGGSYRLRHGLTTYKIVPPRSEMRCYDRGVSLSTGAIKIDELGNLVSPHTGGSSRTVAVKAEVQPSGNIRDFWRTSSVERHVSQFSQAPEGSAKEVSTVSMTARPQEESKPRTDPTCPGPQGAAHQENNRKHIEEVKSQQPRATTTCQRKAAAGNSTEVSFLKPQRRTSSQYVASAIAKRIGPPKTPADVATRFNNAQKACEGGKGRPAALSTSESPSPSQIPKDDAKPPPGCLRGPNREESAITSCPRVEGSNPQVKSPTQDNPTDTHQHTRSYVTASQWDCASSGHSQGWIGKQSMSHQGASSASNSRTLAPSSGNTQTSGKAPENGPRWGPISSEPPRSPTGPSTNGHTEWGPPAMREKPAVSCPDQQEADSALPASIFGPKKKFRPVVQRPAPKDTSLHSALMEAIHSAGGREQLRKTPEHSEERGPKKPSYIESESERSALLAAIRGHRGTCSLRKVSSLASEELQGFRDASLSAQGAENLRTENLGVHPPPPLPPSPPPASWAPSAPRASSGSFSNPADARQALLDAIRSGTGAARLRKVPLLV